MKTLTYHKIQAAINSYIETEDNRLLIDVLPDLEKLWEELSTEEGDYRGGEETYGYQNVLDNMAYIQDRWCAAFRVKWIIDGLKNGKI